MWNKQSVTQAFYLLDLKTNLLIWFELWFMLHTYSPGSLQSVQTLSWCWTGSNHKIISSVTSCLPCNRVRVGQCVAANHRSDFMAMSVLMLWEVEVDNRYCLQVSEYTTWWSDHCWRNHHRPDHPQLLILCLLCLSPEALHLYLFSWIPECYVRYQRFKNWRWMVLHLLKQ